MHLLTFLFVNPDKTLSDCEEAIFNFHVILKKYQLVFMVLRTMGPPWPASAAGTEVQVYFKGYIGIITRSWMCLTSIPQSKSRINLYPCFADPHHPTQPSLTPRYSSHSPTPLLNFPSTSSLCYLRR